jgi:DNA-binding winged helix-turn-helix (wHTH) protein
MPVYRFGPFRLDSDGYRLTRDGRALTASARQLDLLAYFASEPFRLISRDELFDRLWPGVSVTDNALTQLVSEVRQTLGDSSGEPEYVQTVARRGYRFIASVELEPAPALAAHAGGGPAVARVTRETSSLDAMRAVAEGRLQLEALDASQVEAAARNFESAIALDPTYAAGYIGLANAHLWQYESTRHRFQPDSALLARAIAEAKQGLALAPDSAEAHATLAYLLTAADRNAEAHVAARRAVSLQPEYWGHHFRLGHAAWGQARLSALARCLELYPPFPFAYFEMAMVHVARQAFEQARRVLEEGVALQARLGVSRSRFPANGLEWMLGAVHLARGDAAGALTHFDRECARDDRALYAREFGVAALNGRGAAFLDMDRHADAEEAFRSSLATHSEQVRPHLGLALVAAQRGHAGETRDQVGLAQRAVEQLHRGGRATEARLMSAAADCVNGRKDSAVTHLESLMRDAEPGSIGWMIPIEPLFRPLAHIVGFKAVLRQLAERAA